MEGSRPRLVTKHVFLDTCVHIQAKFQYSVGNLRRLSDLVTEGLAHLHDTIVDRGEILAHMAITAEASANALAKFQREATGISRTASPAVAAHFAALSTIEIRGLLLKEYEDYRQRALIKEIDLDGVRLNDIVRDYFSHVAPFSDQKGKKSEFPDALIISALAAWCRATGNRIYVITTDQGMIDAAAATDVLIPLEQLEDLLSLIVSEEQQQFAGEAQRWIEENRLDVYEAVRQQAQSSGFFIVETVGEVEDVTVETIAGKEPRLVEVEDGRATFALACEITFRALLSYDDPESGVWDSEEGKRIATNRCHVEVRRTQACDVEVGLQQAAELSLTERPESMAATEPLSAESIGAILRPPIAGLAIVQASVNGGADIPVSIHDELIVDYDAVVPQFDWYLKDFGERGPGGVLDDELDSEGLGM